MLVRDQSRTPPGRSSRFTSSPVNGAYLERHAQKSSAILTSESACTPSAANGISQRRTKVAEFCFLTRLTTSTHFVRRSNFKGSESMPPSVSILRKRQRENDAAINQRERIQAPPASRTSRAPANLVAKNVRDGDPKQSGNYEQIRKHSYCQS